MCVYVYVLCMCCVYVCVCVCRRMGTQVADVGTHDIYLWRAHNSVLLVKSPYIRNISLACTLARVGIWITCVRPHTRVGVVFGVCMLMSMYVDACV